jgi:hypothetical protein
MRYSQGLPTPAVRCREGCCVRSRRGNTILLLPRRLRIEGRAATHRQFILEFGRHIGSTMSSAGRTDPPTPTVPRSDPSAIPPHRLGGVHQVMHGDSLPSSWSDKVKKSRYFCSFSFFLGFRLRFFFPILKIFSRCGNFGRGNYCCTLRCGCKNVGWVLLPVGFFFFFFLFAAFVCWAKRHIALRRRPFDNSRLCRTERILFF